MSLVRTAQSRISVYGSSDTLNYVWALRGRVRRRMCEGSMQVFGSVSIFPDETRGSCSPPPSTVRKNIFDARGSAEGLSAARLVPEFITIQPANQVTRHRCTLPSTGLPRARDKARNQKAVKENLCPSWYVRLLLRVQELIGRRFNVAFPRS